MTQVQANRPQRGGNRSPDRLPSRRADHVEDFYVRRRDDFLPILLRGPACGAWKVWHTQGATARRFRASGLPLVEAA